MKGFFFSLFVLAQFGFATVQHVSEDQLSSAMGQGVVVVDVYATWCGPCKVMAELLGEMSEERSDLKILGVEMTESLAKQYDIHSLPTIIIMKDGVEKRRFTGVVSKEILYTMVDYLKE